MQRIVFYILAFLFLQICSANADERWRPIETAVQQMLGHKTVTTIFTSKSGEVWIGTVEGVYVYNGREVLSIGFEEHKETTLPESKIVMFFEDSERNLYLVTRDSHIQKYNPSIKKFRKSADVPGSIDLKEYVTSAFYDESGFIWLGHESGNVSRHVIEGRHSWQQWSISSTPVVDLTTDAHGSLFAMSEHGEIAYFESQTEHPPKITESKCIERSNKFSAIAIDSYGNFWIGTRGNGILFQDRNSIVCQDPSLLIDESFPVNFSLLSVHDIEIGINSDEIFAGTNAGIFLIDSSDFLAEDHYRTAYIPGEESIDISLSDEMTLWSGNYSGISMLGKSKTDVYLSGHDDQGKSVVAIRESKNYGRVIATLNGLLVFNKEHGTHQNFKEIYPDARFHDQGIVSLDINEDVVYAGYLNGGFSVYDHRKNSFFDIQTTDDSEKIPPVTTILSISRELAIVGTFGGGLLLYEKGTVRQIKVVTEDPYIDSDRIISIHRDRNEVIWIGTESSLKAFSMLGDTFKEVEIKFDESPNSTIWSVTSSSTGIVYAASPDKALYRFEYSDELQAFESETLSMVSSYENSIVYAVQVDDFDNIWLSTNNGIFRRNSRQNGRLISVVSDTGVLDIGFEHSASMKSPDGSIFFGGIGGYIKISSVKQWPAAKVPSMRILGLFVDNSNNLTSDRFSAREELTITPENSHLLIDFVVDDFFKPNSSIYRYILEGFDQSWIESGSRNNASYTNLPPGNYTFFAQGADSSGTWNEEGIEIEITVLPPWYQTWWAYVFYASILFIFGLFFKKWYDTLLMKEHALALADQMSRTADHAMDDLQDQLEEQDRLAHTMHIRNRDLLGLIEVLTPAIGSPPTGGHAHTLAGHTAALKLLEDSLLFDEYEIQANLKRYTNTLLTQLLEQISLAGGPEINTIVEVTDLSIPAAPASRIALLIYELVNRALASAFPPGSFGNFLSISLSPPDGAGKSGNRWCLLVSHSGSDSGIKSSGDANTESRSSVIELLIDELQADAEFDSESGDTVRIFFRLSNAAPLI